jgi:membrane-bound lytic murein transglycosylase D
MRLSTCLATTLLATLLAAPAQATSSRVQAIEQAMDAAAERYRQALVESENGDEAALARMNQALEDIEDQAQLCFRTRGCESAKVIALYELLLRSHDLGPRAEEQAEADATPGDDHGLSPVLAMSPEAQRTLQALPSGHEFDRMVQINAPVQAAMRDWLTQQRGFLIDAWENYQYMRYLMFPEYERAGLPEALLFGIMAKESGGKVHSVSRAGASGPLQFMHSTGLRFGLGRDATGFDTRFDPQHAARANAAYINERFRELNRSIELTVAAYNGGEGRALRLYQGNPTAPFWSPEMFAQLPPETRDYVPAVLAAAWLFLHPREYGLEFPEIDTTPGEFTLQRQASIAELTICLGNGGTRDGFFRVLRNLNPRYEHTQLIPAGTVLRAPQRAAELYGQNCVQGPRALMAGELMLAQPYLVAAVPNAGPGASSGGSSAAANRRSPGTYRVRRGDNLLAIARQHNCDLTDLARANGLRGPNYMIRPGQRLRLAGCED